MMEDFKDKVNQFKEGNGKTIPPNKDMLMYVVVTVGEIKAQSQSNKDRIDLLIKIFGIALILITGVIGYVFKLIMDIKGG